MKTATIGKIQKNFTKLLKNIKAGEEITIINRGKPVAKIIALGQKEQIDWPDFYNEAIEIKGKPASDIIIESREERF